MIGPNTGAPDRVPGGGASAELLRRPCHLEVMIPARDEERRLPRALTSTMQYLEAQPYSAAIVVIDNGSVDRTVDLVSRVRARRVTVDVIGCAERGKGAAVRRGILSSRSRFIGYMDADLATPIETLDLVVPLLEGGYQAVIGSRRIGGAALAQRQPGGRVIGGMVFREFAKRVVPGIADTQCGFKFFTGDIARAAASRLHVEGFAFDVELLRAVIREGARVKEIPVIWTDKDGSTFHPARDGLRTAADLVRLACVGAK